MASNAKNNFPFVRGEHITFKYYQSGSPVYFQATNWTCEANGTEVAEGVNGENRDRLDYVLNYFSASIDMNQTDEEPMNAIIADQENEDAANLPLDRQAAVLIRHRDGTKAAYLLKDCVIGPWNTAMSGRADPYKLTLKLRFVDWTPAPTF